MTVEQRVQDYLEKARPAVAAHLASMIETPDVAGARYAADRLGPFSVPIQASDGSRLFLVR